MHYLCKSQMIPKRECCCLAWAVTVPFLLYGLKRDQNRLRSLVNNSLCFHYMTFFFPRIERSKSIYAKISDELHASVPKTQTFTAWTRHAKLTILKLNRTHFLGIPFVKRKLNLDSGFSSRELLLSETNSYIDAFLDTNLNLLKPRFNQYTFLSNLHFLLL